MMSDKTFLIVVLILLLLILLLSTDTVSKRVNAAQVSELYAQYTKKPAPKKPDVPAADPVDTELCSLEEKGLGFIPDSQSPTKRPRFTFIRRGPTNFRMTDSPLGKRVRSPQGSVDLGQSPSKRGEGPGGPMEPISRINQPIAGGMSPLRPHLSTLHPDRWEMWF